MVLRLDARYFRCSLNEEMNSEISVVTRKSMIQRYDYKIQYNDISKLFLLEKPDERYVAFVVSLDKPIRQGQQKYQHLVLRTTKVNVLYDDFTTTQLVKIILVV